MSDLRGIRINKFLSESGLCSRREADRMIEQGRITINGRQPEAGQRVKKKDVVKADGREIDNNQEDAVYLAFNKPVGIVCTTDTKAEKDNIISYVNYPKRIFPVGRLDKPSEGLIFLTSDGDIVNKILRAGNKHEKEYEVTVDKPINASFIEQMAQGIPILGTMTRKCKVESVGSHSFRITLTQGLNRQIRRMCEHLGYEVVKLKRTRIMNIKLDVPPGQWREFTPDEISEIETAISSSSSTQKNKGKSHSKPNRKTGKQVKTKLGSRTKKPAKKSGNTSFKSGKKASKRGAKGRKR